MSADVHASVKIRASPEVAFVIFTDEIGRWWRPGPNFCMDANRAIGVRIERGIGGRWLELYDELGDDAFVIGKVSAWEPGDCVAFRDHSRVLDVLDFETEVEVRFAAEGDGTRVQVMRAGWDQLDPAAADAERNGSRRGWESVLSWFQDWADWGSPLRIERPRNDRRLYVLEPGEGVSEGDSALKASRRSTIGGMTLIESRTNGGAPLHAHAFDDEGFYVLDGTITVGDGETTHEVHKGGFAFIPRGVVHEWDVLGDEASVLIITAPGGLDEFLGEIHTARPTNLADWNRLGATYGYTFL